MPINIGMSEKLTQIAVYTLVDITFNENANRQNSLIESNQHRNWQTVFQIISLRTQVAIEVFPTSPKLVSLAGHHFGSYYKGQQRCWKFIFSVEPTDLFGDVDDPTRILKQDFNNVPILVKLNESVDIVDPVFYTDGILKNIYFRILD